MAKVRGPKLTFEVNTSQPGEEGTENKDYFKKIFRSGNREESDKDKLKDKKDMKKKQSCATICIKFLYIALGIITILLSIATIAVTVATGVATKIYSSDMSGRLVAMILLAVTAAITLCVTIYSSIAIFRKQSRPVHVAAVALVIIAIIQAVICGVSVRVTAEDEFNLTRSLTESFHLSKEDSPRHVRIWATTQYDLSCCGVFGPEDYRPPRLPTYFSPDVPISCCPSYEPDRSELVQERSRELCKSKREYYNVGCKSLVLDCFRETATVVLSICITLMLFEIMEAVLGSFISREQTNKVASLKGAEEGAPEKPKRQKEDSDQTKSKVTAAKVKSPDETEPAKIKTPAVNKPSQKP
ncbi:uncharacterized protein LOC126367346 isoform X3 [Pectinophora gossypiella]|uniref:uncharacterized protein LOC126367346 isoform X3 n=1 Tax=Pectinophora gossypiella TaxID=13191 RepID=UPI00214E75A4|nr:uncharacterized protein LOC126367346 isoform X3 [Pectinophora gossypiella]